MAEKAPDSEARDFAAAFRSFLEWIHSAGDQERNEVSALVRDGAVLCPLRPVTGSSFA